MTRVATPASVWPTPEQLIQGARLVRGSRWRNLNNGDLLTLTGEVRKYGRGRQFIATDEIGEHERAIHPDEPGFSQTSRYVSGPTGWERGEMRIEREGWVRTGPRTWHGGTPFFAATGVLLVPGGARWSYSNADSVWTGGAGGPLPIIAGMIAAERCAAEHAAQAGRRAA